MQIKTGHVLIRTSARAPEHLDVGGNPVGTGWTLLNEDVDSFDRKVRAADWHFFRITEEIQAIAIARRMEDAVAKRAQGAPTNQRAL